MVPPGGLRDGMSAGCRAGSPPALLALRQNPVRRSIRAGHGWIPTFAHLPVAWVVVICSASAWVAA